MKPDATEKLEWDKGPFFPNGKKVPPEQANPAGAGTLTPAATAAWPRTNAAGHFPFPVRGRTRSRRPWWRFPRRTEELFHAGLAWAKQYPPQRWVWISRLPGRGNWLVLYLKTYFLFFLLRFFVCFEAAIAAPAGKAGNKRRGNAPVRGNRTPGKLYSVSVRRISRLPERARYIGG